MTEILTDKELQDAKDEAEDCSCDPLYEVLRMNGVNLSNTKLYNKARSSYNMDKISFYSRLFLLTIFLPFHVAWSIILQGFPQTFRDLSHLHRDILRQYRKLRS